MQQSIHNHPKNHSKSIPKMIQENIEKYHQKYHQLCDFGVPFWVNFGDILEPLLAVARFC
jgi:hypothetical protein